MIESHMLYLIIKPKKYNEFLGKPLPEELKGEIQISLNKLESSMPSSQNPIGYIFS